MIQWLCDIICKKGTTEVVERAFEDVLENRIIDLRRRIAAAQSSHASVYQSNKNTQTQPKQLVDEAKRKPQTPMARTREEDNRVAKENELNDLKAKLMGKKG